MKTLILIISSLFVFNFIAHSQTSTDSIHVMKSLGTFFVQNGKKLKPKHLLDITRSNPDAYNIMLDAKSNYNMGFIFGGVGGFMLGWSFGYALTGNNPDGALIGAGAGLTVISIAFTAAYNKKAKEAIRLYNSGLSGTGMRTPHLEFGITNDGMGILMTF